MYNLSPFTYSYSPSSALAHEKRSRRIFLEQPLSFKKGETIAITGPSGAGKSTLLKILKGIIPEYGSGVLEGQIAFYDRPLTGEHFKLNMKKILYLFQNPFSQLIYPRAEEEFLFSMENFNFTREKMEEQFDKLSCQFNLQRVWGKKTSTLSSGECQKLVLSSLLAIEPEVLLFDEPTAFLDPQARKEFYDFLKEIKGRYLLIIIDHHEKEIDALVDRVLFVGREGKISEGDKRPEKKVSLLRPALPWTLPEHEAPSPIAIAVKKMDFSYEKKTPLLKDVNVTMAGGEVVFIKGKNGEGKSTFLKLLAGIMTPDAGSIHTTIGSRTYKNASIFSQTGFVFQNPESHFFFDTIEEELRQSLKNFTEEETATKWLERFFSGIDLQKSPFLLSEGEKRRLSILMSVFLNKNIIFYDEPTFGQDAESILEIASLIKALKQTGILQVIISHDDAFIEKVADRVLVLEEGRLSEIKPT